ncbi:hypothetical protein AK812_SmicGene31569 [Symbiodinium microadriaticum]|uniref:Uncharacterized protein n=1 Tax=Symbiodinium microadriaticum TaxID=2951 RepID=A0A1Q9CWD4_SYMMI|nr:hypothetical protein AK812_SmicGene31569 [Symbiodinium microadriaticum]
MNMWDACCALLGRELRLLLAELEDFRHVLRDNRPVDVDNRARGCGQRGLVAVDREASRLTVAMVLSYSRLCGPSLCRDSSFSISPGPGGDVLQNA